MCSNTSIREAGEESTVRRYDDPVEVRKGAEEAPEQFLWRGRLWKVRAVLAHWVETGSWWQTPDRPDLLQERELWTVEAGRGAVPTGSVEGVGGRDGVFDLCFDWDTGSWQLVGCHD